MWAFWRWVRGRCPNRLAMVMARRNLAVVVGAAPVQSKQACEPRSRKWLTIVILALLLPHSNCRKRDLVVEQVLVI